MPTINNLRFVQLLDSRNVPSSLFEIIYNVRSKIIIIKNSSDTTSTVIYIPSSCYMGIIVFYSH